MLRGCRRQHRLTTSISEVISEDRFSRVFLGFFFGERGITLMEITLALTISSVIALSVLSAFTNTVRVNDQSSAIIANQLDAITIAQRLRDDILKADPVIPDPANPSGPSDHFDFAESEVAVSGGALVKSYTYFRYERSGGAVVKLPATYDDELGAMASTGEDPVWSYGDSVSRLEFEYDISPASGAVLMVTVHITVGVGNEAYSQTISVAPRNSV
jgi:type II secretory pathway pseudopilin PulG